jgi:haloalkane dehalogenase
MRVLRTPESRFVDLPGYPFAPQYVEIDGLRVHYLDEGPADAAPVLLLHGEPTWSYLYRKMIPPLVDAGHRVVAPDFVGFGRSDKPGDRSDYTYQRHVDWMTAFLRAVALEHITLFCQDWGGLIGLRLVAEHGALFDGVVAANTFLPTGDQDPGPAFRKWQAYSQATTSFEAGKIVARTCKTEVPPEVQRAYDAPFPDESFQAGARQFPLLVPVRAVDPASAPNRAAWTALREWRKPFLTAFSDSDPITRGADEPFRALIPGCAGQPHTTIAGASHFLQEDRGEAVAEVLVAFIARNRA